jgi:hypothetical protein
MPTVKPMAGLTFGLWKVLHQCEKPEGVAGRDAFWMCECQCELKTRRAVSGSNLRSGITNSCGCQQHKGQARTHGKTGQPAYKIWQSMKKRCSNPKEVSWPNYGGREGNPVRVCQRMQTFEGFYAVMGDRPDDLEIDRTDPNGHYSCGGCPECLEKGWPLNCRWVTNKEQCRNKRDTLKIKVGDEEVPLLTYAEQVSVVVPPTTVVDRVRRGWSVDEALVVPVESRDMGLVTYRGEQRRIQDLARERGLEPLVVYKRVKRGWDVDRALDTPVRQYKTYLWEGEQRSLAEIASLVGVDASRLWYKVGRRGMELSAAIATLLN